MKEHIGKQQEEQMKKHPTTVKRMIHTLVA